MKAILRLIEFRGIEVKAIACLSESLEELG